MVRKESLLFGYLHVVTSLNGLFFYTSVIASQTGYDKGVRQVVYCVQTTNVAVILISGSALVTKLYLVVEA